MANSSVGPARSGRKNPQLLERKETVVDILGVGPVFVCTIKPLQYGEYTLTEGVEVPGAGDWVRVEAWVSARRIKAVPADSDYIRFEDFVAALEAPGPDLEAELPAEQDGEPTKELVDKDLDKVPAQTE